MEKGCLDDMHVLVIEDDQECRDLLALFMKHEGAEVIKLGEAEPALKVLKEQEFDAVTLDIRLPGMSGLDLLAHVREEYDDLPVILITGHGSLDTAVNALKLGAQDYLVKPLVDGDELVHAIGRAVQHRRLKIKNIQLQEQLRQSEERERARLGQELHDVLCQDLASIEMLSSLVKKNIDIEDEKLNKDLNLVHKLAARSLLFTKKLCIGLFPVELEHEGLGSALETLVNDQEHIHAVKCNLELGSNVEVEDKACALHVYRIAQEAMNNAVRNGGAKNVLVELKGGHKDRTLTVVDDGKGISSDSEGSGGLGLHIMKYRADMIGGELEVVARDEGGTSVKCKWQAEG